MKKTYLSNIQETRRLSTSLASMFSSFEMKGMWILVYGFINLIKTCVLIFLSRSVNERLLRICFFYFMLKLIIELLRIIFWETPCQGYYYPNINVNTVKPLIANPSVPQITDLVNSEFSSSEISAGRLGLWSWQKPQGSWTWSLFIDFLAHNLPFDLCRSRQAWIVIAVEDTTTFDAIAIYGVLCK